MIFSQRYLDSDRINFKTLVCLAVYWSIWTSLCNIDIKDIKNSSLHNVNVFNNVSTLNIWAAWNYQNYASESSISAKSRKLVHVYGLHGQMNLNSVRFGKHPLMDWWRHAPPPLKFLECMTSPLQIPSKKCEWTKTVKCWPPRINLSTQM